MSGSSFTAVRESARLGAAHAALLVLGGVLTGGIGGFWGLTGDGSLQTADAAARPFIALSAVLPLLILVLSVSPAKLDAYRSPGRGLVIGLVGGVAGGLLGAIGYIVPATNIPVILGGENAADLSTAIRTEIGLTRFLVVVGITVVVAVVVGVLTHYRVRAYRRQQSGTS